MLKLNAFINGHIVTSISYRYVSASEIQASVGFKTTPISMTVNNVFISRNFGRKT